MGQAKQRGTFEHRQAEGKERKRQEYEMRLAIQIRRPSPKHTAFMASMLIELQEILQDSGMPKTRTNT